MSAATRAQLCQNLSFLPSLVLNCPWGALVNHGKTKAFSSLRLLLLRLHEQLPIKFQRIGSHQELLRGSSLWMASPGPLWLPWWQLLENTPAVDSWLHSESWGMSLPGDGFSSTTVRGFPRALWGTSPWRDFLHPTGSCLVPLSHFWGGSSYLLRNCLHIGYHHVALCWICCFCYCCTEELNNPGSLHWGTPSTPF